MSEEKLFHFEVLKAVRDAHVVKKIDRALLDALILRGDFSKEFASYASYRKLSEDTGYDPQSLLKSAARLVEMGLITKKRRKHSTCIFRVNVKRIVRLRDEEFARGSNNSRIRDEDLNDPELQFVDEDEDYSSATLEEEQRLGIAPLEEDVSDI